jgi:formate hydrogenlyase subunit 3/multisubunit Na+/H+ antiporter MnhD subunit
MVNPILLIALPLGAAFLINLTEKAGRRLSLVLFFAVLLFSLGYSGYSLYRFLFLRMEGGEIFTAGFRPPWSIALRMGGLEALLLFASYLVALGAAIYRFRQFAQGPAQALVLFMAILLGAAGIIMTRDLFNLFVFMEISSIATAGAAVFRRDRKSLEAGFKYLIAGAIASAFFLIGTIYLYRISGSLYLEDIAAARPFLSAGGFTAAFLVVAAILVELKPYPANGWALDYYQAVDPGIVSVVATVNSGAMMLALWKVLPLAGPKVAVTIMAAGTATFFFSNLAGLRQKDRRRMLGYSSAAQTGLLLVAIALTALGGFGAAGALVVIGGFYLNHLLAKASLFWGVEAAESLEQFETGTAGSLAPEGAGKLLRGGKKIPRAGTLLLLGLSILALAGLPPFPGFWAKWQLITRLLPGIPGIAASAESAAVTARPGLFPGAVAAAAFILLGSLFEAGYMLRWFGKLISGFRLRMAEAGTVAEAYQAAGTGEAVGVGKASEEAARSEKGTGPASGGSFGTAALGSTTLGSASFTVPSLIAALLLVGSGIGSALFLGVAPELLYWLVGSALVMMLLALLPNLGAGILTLGIIAGFGYWSYPFTAGLARFFWIIFIPGGGLVAFAALAKGAGPGSSGKGGAAGSFRSSWFWPGAGTMIISLGLLTVVKRPLEFFFVWEGMTLASYLLLFRGKRRQDSEKAAYRYILFSLGGAFAMLAGFALSGAGEAATLAELQPITPIALLLILIGFLVKMGSAVLHIWLPDAYAEAEDPASALFSAILSKAGVFGLFAAGTLLVGNVIPLFGSAAGSAAAGSSAAGGAAAGGMAPLLGMIDIPFVLRWTGALTALFGALLAVFQEDVKRLLAYSSMSQLGYVVLAFGVMSSLGWTSALYITFLHAIFKTMLFLSVAGVIYRTGKRNMYEMGGLIKKMPLSFLSSLMAIIAVSGVPPLAGFGSKWLIYTALIEGGHYLLAAVAFFSSTIAFLYLFRFIHTVFLGQLKVEHREVKEAPLPIILPQQLLFIPLMAISIFPAFLVKAASAIVGEYLPINFSWEGFTLHSSLGYWNATAVMAVTAGAFLVPLIWLIIVQRRPRPVGQFNIVFAAERPLRPETTHVAHNFFQPYQRALGFLVKPGALRFWNWIEGATAALGGAFRRVYTGNGRTYALTIVLYVAILYFVSGRII